MSIEFMLAEALAELRLINQHLKHILETTK